MAKGCCRGIEAAENVPGMTSGTSKTEPHSGERAEPVVPVATDTAKALVAMAVSMLGWDHTELDFKEDAIRRYVLEQYPLLSRAPNRQDIATACRLGGEEEVQALLERLHALDILFLEPGTHEIRLAYPFSSVPTAHVVRFPDWSEAKPVYSQCAVDALGIPFMFRRDVSITSSCAHCAQPIAINVRNGAIVAHHPTETMVWAGATRTGPAATSVCPTINFFCSSAHALAWRQDQRDAAGHVLSLGEALYLGKGIFEDLLTEKPDPTPPTTRTPRLPQPGNAATTATSVGGLVAAVLASVCCLGPLALAAFGVGVGVTGFWASTGGFLKALLPYRPWFIGFAGLCFAISFYLVYLRADRACTPDETCQRGASNGFTRRLLWALAVLALGLVLAPYWLGL